VASTRTTRAGGVALALGASTWAATLLIAPPDGDTSYTIEILGGLAYQIGLAGLLAAAWATRALGTGRAATIVLRSEAVVLALASAWSLVYAIDPRTGDHPVMVALDVCWPLSMLGLVAVGAFIARARVWQRPLRQLPLIASLWLPLDITVMLVAGDTAGLIFRAAWLVLVWGGTGVLIARLGPASPPHSGIPRHGSAQRRQQHAASRRPSSVEELS
jgi:hypothetical protein